MTPADPAVVEDGDDAPAPFATCSNRKYDGCPYYVKTIGCSVNCVGWCPRINSSDPDCFGKKPCAGNPHGRFEGPTTRLRRRTRFAAPLVMVVACGQAPPAAIPVESPAGMEPAVAAVPVDAAPPDAAPQPIDAALALAVAREGYVVLLFPAHTVQPPGFGSCHNFGPRNRGCNPPRPVRVPADRRAVPILDIGPTAGGHLIVIDVGAPDLIKRDSAILVRAPLRPPRRHGCAASTATWPGSSWRSATPSSSPSASAPTTT